MTALERMRLDRGAHHLHTLGPRSIAEFLAEISDAVGGAPCILQHLGEYERLSPAMIQAAGADRFPPRPLRVVV